MPDQTDSYRVERSTKSSGTVVYKIETIYVMDDKSFTEQRARQVIQSHSVAGE